MNSVMNEYAQLSKYKLKVSKKLLTTTGLQKSTPIKNMRQKKFINEKSSQIKFDFHEKY